jgi:hypothetical protein
MFDLCVIWEDGTENTYNNIDPAMPEFKELGSFNLGKDHISASKFYFPD